MTSKLPQRSGSSPSEDHRQSPHPAEPQSHLQTSQHNPASQRSTLTRRGYNLPHPEQLPHLRVSELAARLADCVQFHFANLNVRGEIGSLKQGRGGHLFITLKEGDASIDAVIWSREVKSLSFIPKVGDEVIVNGDLKMRPRSGNASFQVRHLTPTGEGLMQAEFERIREQFRAQGLFDRALPIPKLPRCVGLVTSYNTSAYHDFYKTRGERAPGVKVVFEDAVVQGNESLASLSRALRRLYENPQVDVIALIRGGGSMEHLWDFNHPELCYLITQSPKPIVVGIGHEDNTLLAELVADVRGYTPTGVAAIIFPHVRELKRALNALTDRLDHAMQSIGVQRAQHLQHLSLALAPLCSTDRLTQELEQRYFTLERSLERHVTHKRQRLDQLRDRLHHEAPHLRVERAGHRLQRLSDELMRHEPVLKHAEHQEALASHLNLGVDQHLESARLRLMSLAQQLETLSPLRTLARGYSLVRHVEGSTIDSSAQVSVGDQISITLRDGEVIAEVSETRHTVESQSTPHI